MRASSKSSSATAAAAVARRWLLSAKQPPTSSSTTYNPSSSLHPSEFCHRRCASSSSAAAVVVDDITPSNESNKASNATKSNANVNPHFPKLFEPLPLHPAIGTLPNRILMGSMHTGLEGHSIPSFLLPLLKADEHHDDLSAMAEYFRIRAEGGVGLMVTGGISPNKAGWVAPFAAKLDSVEEMERHKLVTDAVHSVRIPSYGNTKEEGSEPARICLQILHTGRYAMHPFAVSASATKSPISPFPAKALSLAGVHDTIRDFVTCATLAKAAGYDGVEIMGSEGYLINQFLVSKTNKRTDEYGGDFAHRMRFAAEIVQQTRAAVGEDFILIFRLSMLDLVKDGSSWEEIQLLAQAIEDAGATIINTGIGWHEARIPTIATSVPRATFARVTRKLKQENIVSIPLCATNRINAPHVGEEVIAGGDADLVSMARPFLADPHIVAKSRRGEVDDINTCIACNQACLDHAFVGKTASCLVNPLACHETELKVEPDSVSPENRLEIGVIGSGPAGMAFATVAATIGHHVTLYDKATEIGGQFNMAKRIPGKEEFHETIRYFGHQLSKLERSGKLTMRMGTEMTHDEMESNENIDRWIVAAGVDPRVPPIPGLDHPNVLSYIDVLRHKKPVGRRVAIIGAGGIGFDVAEYLLHHDDGADHDLLADETSSDEFLEDWGVDQSMEERGGLTAETAGASAAPHRPQREIVLMQRKKGKLGAGLGKTTGWIHRATLSKSGSVEMIGSVSYDRVDEQGRLHVTVGGDKGGEASIRILDVDNIVVCAGQISKKELEKEAKGTALAEKVFTIGGAYEAGELDAKRAIDMGTRLALRIHEDDVVPGRHKFEAGKGPEEQLFSFLKRFT